MNVNQPINLTFLDDGRIVCLTRERFFPLCQPSLKPKIFLLVKSFFLEGVGGRESNLTFLDDGRIV